MLLIARIQYAPDKKKKNLANTRGAYLNFYGNTIFDYFFSQTVNHNLEINLQYKACIIHQAKNLINHGSKCSNN